jgi:signal recognition particle receptor subunit beta
MTRALTFITTDQQLSERRGIKVVINGKSGIGKTSQIADLANALPPIVFLPLDADDESSEPEVRS